MKHKCDQCQDTGMWDYYDYEGEVIVAKPIGEGEYFSYCECELGERLYDENTMELERG